VSFAARGKPRRFPCARPAVSPALSTLFLFFFFVLVLLFLLFLKKIEEDEDKDDMLRGILVLGSSLEAFEVPMSFIGIGMLEFGIFTQLFPRQLTF
jgi:uncharacterized membrane protein